MLLAETRCYKQRLLNSRKSKELLKQKKTMPRVTIALEVNDPDVTRFGNLFLLSIWTLATDKNNISWPFSVGVKILP